MLHDTPDGNTGPLEIAYSPVPKSAPTPERNPGGPCPSSPILAELTSGGGLG